MLVNLCREIRGSVDMSFRDEMKASLKTPQQVMSEKENAELHKIKESAVAEFEIRLPPSHWL